LCCFAGIEMHKKNCNILGVGSEPAWGAEWDMGKKECKRKFTKKK
jgi:hypothetical protein